MYIHIDTKKRIKSPRKVKGRTGVIHGSIKDLTVAEMITEGIYEFLSAPKPKPHQMVATETFEQNDNLATYTQVTTFKNKPIEALREIKKTSIRNWFNSVKDQNVEVTINGTMSVWHGGFESAQKLDGGYRLSIRTNATTINLYDVNNNKHTLSMEDANTIICTIAAKYQNDFSTKQSLMVQTDAANTLEQINEVVIPKIVV